MTADSELLPALQVWLAVGVLLLVNLVSLQLGCCCAAAAGAGVFNP